MTDPDRRPLPESLTRLLAERAPEPTPEEQFQAYLDEHARDAKRWRVRGPSPPGQRTWTGFVVPMGLLVAVIATLVWRVLW